MTAFIGERRHRVSVIISWPVDVNGELQCVCDFGVIEHTGPRPEYGEIGQLCLAEVEWVHRLLRNEVITGWPKHWSAHQRDGRIFITLKHLGDNREVLGTWVWECHEASWDPETTPHRGERHQPIYVGRWPD
jgi:hypothetical protein